MFTQLRQILISWPVDLVFIVRQYQGPIIQGELIHCLPLRWITDLTVDEKEETLYVTKQNAMAVVELSRGVPMVTREITTYHRDYDFSKPFTGFSHWYFNWTFALWRGFGYGFHTDKIHVMNPTSGEWLRSICVPIESYGRPCSAVVYRDHLYLVATKGHCINVLNLVTEQLTRRISGPGTRLGKLRNPSDLTIVEDEIFVCDQENHRVQVFSVKTGKVLRVIGDSSHFHFPSGIAVREDEVYITDLTHDYVMIFTKLGKYLGKLGKVTPRDGTYFGHTLLFWKGYLVVADHFADKLLFYS
jgi:hypothetical protein